MKKEIMQAPVWSASPFSEDEKEIKESERQYEDYRAFYFDLLPKVAGLMWTDENCVSYVFSHDTIHPGEFRVSVFDEKGAIRHTARETICDLFRAENFPWDGRQLVVVTAA